MYTTSLASKKRNTVCNSCNANMKGISYCLRKEQTADVNKIAEKDISLKEATATCRAFARLRQNNDQEELKHEEPQPR